MLGVGSPLLDILVEVDDVFLAERVSGDKGGMEMVDAAAQQAILAQLPGKPRLVPGGSARQYRVRAGPARIGLRDVRQARQRRPMAASTGTG